MKRRSLWENAPECGDLCVVGGDNEGQDREHLDLGVPRSRFAEAQQRSRTIKRKPSVLGVNKNRVRGQRTARASPHHPNSYWQQRSFRSIPAIVPLHLHGPLARRGALGPLQP